ncbi:phage portal protein [Methylobacterium sp. WL6]|uniref:phage portal protein n=1 Tax=Methylobacterium sp. WL6 TaxID=2603901 RepID=UPI0011C9A624|nr:phage portal protein [Methylobacterium sp. WL6]TXN71732.1 phage portal protein [Methylobacterium sp. WL6]
MSLLSFLGRTLTLRNAYNERGQNFWSLFGGFESWTGKAVTPDSVMQIATALACIRLTATTVSTLPVHVYRESPDGSRQRIPDHPMAVVLRQSPNADQTPAEFLEGMVACTMLFGNAFALKTKTAGQVRALTILRPDLMTVRRDPNTYALIYEYADPRGRETYTAEDVWHLKAFSLGGDLGLSAVQYGRQAFGLALATDEAAARTFANGIKPGGFFISQKPLDAPQREQARKALVEPMQGAENTGRVGILEGNFTWQSVTMPLKDAELLASRGLHIQEICRLMGNIPSVLIGHTGEGVTAWGSGIESLIRAWLTTGLGPLLGRIEQSATRALLAPADRGKVWCEFARDGLLQADSEARGKLYASAAQNGWRTRNEIRALENLPPVDGGDVLTAQSNLLPLDKLGTLVGAAQRDPATSEEDIRQ